MPHLQGLRLPGVLSEGQSSARVSALRGPETRTAVMRGLQQLECGAEWRPALERKYPDPPAEQNCRLPDEG